MTTAALDLAQPGPVAQRTRPIAVVLSRFPTVTETFILREFVEMERQGQPVRLVPMIKETPPFIHDAAQPWTDRALYTPFVSPAILAANVRAFFKRPLHYLGVLAKLIAGTIHKPGRLIRTLALFPKSVLLAEKLTAE